MKRGPIIFILVLLSTLIFILGVQYGKTVNVADEALSILMSITPSVVPTIPSQKNDTYTIYTNDTCNISFLYPSSLQLKDASTEASFVSSDKTNELIISCDDNHEPSQMLQEHTATRSVELQQFSIVGEDLQNTEGVFVRFSRKHPYNNRMIVVTMNENLLPLIEKTFEFIRPL